MAESAKPFDIHALCTVHIVEEFIQLLHGSDVVVIANSIRTKDLALHFSLEHS